jgi:hypothetical protein
MRPYLSLMFVGLLSGPAALSRGGEAPTAPTAPESTQNSAELRDPAFERHVDLSLLPRACAELDPVLLTDVGLQLAEGERILFRPHITLSAEEVLDTATRAATAKNDQATLVRLALAADKFGNQGLKSRVIAAQKLAAGTRSEHPALQVSAEELTPELFSECQQLLRLISSARILNDRPFLDESERQLNALQGLPAKHVTYFRKLIEENRSAIPNDGGADLTTEALRKLSGLSRAVHPGFPNFVRFNANAPDRFDRLIFVTDLAPCYPNTLDIDRWFVSTARDYYRQSLTRPWNVNCWASVGHNSPVVVGWFDPHPEARERRGWLAIYRDPRSWYWLDYTGARGSLADGTGKDENFPANQPKGLVWLTVYNPPGSDGWRPDQCHFWIRRRWYMENYLRTSNNGPIERLPGMISDYVKSEYIEPLRAGGIPVKFTIPAGAIGEFAFFGWYNPRDKSLNGTVTWNYGPVPVQKIERRFERCGETHGVVYFHDMKLDKTGLGNVELGGWEAYVKVSKTDGRFLGGRLRAMYYDPRNSRNPKRWTEWRAFRWDSSDDNIVSGGRPVG